MSDRKGSSKWLYIVVLIVLVAAAAYVLTREDQSAAYDLVR